MKIYNHELEAFVKFLFELNLVGKTSRMRTRLIKNLEAKYAQLQEERIEIAKRYAKKDELGSPIIIQRDNKELIDLEDDISANREMVELLNEIAVVEQNEENKEMLLSVKDTVLNYSEPLSGNQSFEWDRWCEICENVHYDNR